MSIEDKLYLFGGSGPSAICFNDLQIFDSVNNTWQVAQIYDEDNLGNFGGLMEVKPRAGHSMSVFDENKLIIVGGSCN